MTCEATQFKPGQSGNPTGKPKGAQNKKSLAKLACKRFGCDPFEILAQIAMGILTDRDGRPAKIDTRLRMESAAELAQYLEPKQKAIEYKSDEASPLNFTIVMGKAQESN